MDNKVKDINPEIAHTMEDGKFVGRFPIRQDIEILPADNSNQKTLGWVVHERRGGEVYFADDPYQSPIIDIDMLKLGDKIIVPTLLCSMEMSVTQISIGGKAQAENQGTIALLDYGIDDRNCWTSECAINKKCLNKLSIKK